MMRAFAVSLMCALSFLACGDSSNPPSTPSSPQASEDGSIEGGWRLVDGRGPGGEIPKGDGVQITLDIEGSTATGRSACNQYFSEIDETEGSFRLRGLGGTEMACPGPPMEAEALYLEALADVDSRRMEGDVLVLAGPKTELLFQRVPPVPTADLTGTEWQLEGLIHGRGGGATVSSAHPATLTLQPDGRLTGSTGCRELTGRWEEQPSHINVPELTAGGRCSKELQQQDGHVVEVIGDGFTVEIEENTLRVKSLIGARGLLYRAE